MINSHRMCEMANILDTVSMVTKHVIGATKVIKKIMKVADFVLLKELTGNLGGCSLFHSGYLTCMMPWV